MKKIHLALAAIAGLSGIATAATGPVAGTKFLLLGDFATPTADAVEFAAEYNGKTYGDAVAPCTGCKAVPTSIKEAGVDFARVNFALAPTGTGTYFANIGFMLPFDNLWSTETDLRAVTLIKFKARSSAAFTLKVNLDGPAFPFGSGGYTRLKNVITGPDWTWYSMQPKDFKYIDWMLADAKAGIKMVNISTTDADGNNGPTVPVKITARAVAGKLLGADSISSPDYDKDSINALKHVKMIQFGIDPVYDAAATPGGSALDPDFAATVTDATLDIDSVLFEGVDGGWAPIKGTKCTGAFGLLEDFGAGKVDANANYLGGYWFAYSDTNSLTVAAGKDSAIGMSKVWATGQDTTDPESAWSLNIDNGSADMFALLNKGNVKAHPYAGFAELGTGINSKTGKALTGAKAFEFTILAGGTDETAVTFDKAKLTGVTFKVGKKSVSDDVTFSAKIPFDQIGPGVNGAPQTVCVDIDQLKQPAWYTAKNGSKAFTVDSVTQLAWNVSIQKQTEATAKAALIQVSNVKIYGIDQKILPQEPGAVKGISARGTKSLEASYQKNLVVSYSVAGTKAQLEIVRMDGSKVASFSVAASATNLSLPVSLNNGTYMVVVRGEGSRQTVTLPVLGR